MYWKFMKTFLAHIGHLWWCTYIYHHLNTIKSSQLLKLKFNSHLLHSVPSSGEKLSSTAAPHPHQAAPAEAATSSARKQTGPPCVAKCKFVFTVHIFQTKSYPKKEA